MQVKGVLCGVALVVLVVLCSSASVAETDGAAAESVKPAAPPSTAAQPTPESNAAPFAGFTEAQRRSMITANIAFGKDEADGFWPLYRDYRRDIAKWQDRRDKALNEYAEIFRAMTSEQADAILEDFLQADEGIAKVKRDYQKKFRKFLPDTKLTRFYLIDAKIDLAGEAILMTKVQTIGEAPR
jgi:hypothetical protein